MIYIIVAMLFYTAALICITLASRKIDGAIVTGIGNTLSAIIPLVVAIPLLNKNLVANQRGAIFYAVLAGIFIAIFGIALSRSFAVNKVAIVSPIVFGGAIFLTTIISAVFLKEKIGLIQGIGLALMFVGLSFVIYSRAVAK